MEKDIKKGIPDYIDVPGITVVSDLTKSVANKHSEVPFIALFNNKSGFLESLYRIKKKRFRLEDEPGCEMYKTFPEGALYILFLGDWWRLETTDTITQEFINTLSKMFNVQKKTICTMYWGPWVNSSAKKNIVRIIDEFSIHKRQGCDVELIWIYNCSDPDIRDDAEDYTKLNDSGFPNKIIELGYSTDGIKDSNESLIDEENEI